MYRKISLFFFHLTKENWGFPYHIILAIILTKIVLFAMSFISFPIGYEFYPSAIAWVTVNLVGYINEVVQKSTRRDFLQDMTGNNIGWLIEVL